MSNRQKRTIGSILKIPVDNYYIHAQILEEVDMVYFDTKGKENLSLHDITESPILFRVSTNDDAILNGKWKKIGKAEVKGELAKPVKKFIQDALNPDKFKIYFNGEIRPATKKECERLDRAAVWAVNHIEDRIKDHYNNKPNIWVEQMSIK